MPTNLEASKALAALDWWESEHGYKWGRLPAGPSDPVEWYARCPMLPRRLRYRLSAPDPDTLLIAIAQHYADAHPQ